MSALLAGLYLILQPSSSIGKRAEWIAQAATSFNPLFK